MNNNSMKYVRIQGRETAYRTGMPVGIFAAVHRLQEAGLLTMDHGFNFIVEDFTVGPLVIANKLPFNPLKTLNEPTTHSWGARSFQFRDPDGNILNFRTIPKE